MYKLRIVHRYPEDRKDACWFEEHEYPTKEAALEYLYRNFDMEDPFLPYKFEIIDPNGEII